MDKQSRSWILTLPAEKYTKLEVEEKLSKFSGVVGQLEEGEKTQFLHWQILIENDYPIRFSSLRKLFPQGHYEPRKADLGTALAYVTKKETFAGVTINIGSIKTTSEQGKRTDLERYAELIKIGYSPLEVVDQHPQAFIFLPRLRELSSLVEAEKFSKKIRRDLHVSYFWGEPGCGKTRYCYEKLEDFFRVTTYEHPWESYKNEPILVLDEFCFPWSVDFLLNVLDIYPLQLPSRYCDRWAAWEQVVILSNFSLEYWCEIRNVPSIQWEALNRRIHVNRKFGDMG